MQTGWQTIDRKTYYCIRRPADRLALEDGARYMGTDGGLQKGLVKVGSY